MTNKKKICYNLINVVLRINFTIIFKINFNILQYNFQTLIAAFFVLFFCLYFKAAKSRNGKLRFVKSRWGGKLLVLDGYYFSSNKRDNKGVTYYRCTFCSSRKKNPCHARCIVRNGKIVKISNSHHNHPKTTIKSSPL
jgi:anaerobic selenocysteine-containing dehydrogenase